MSESPRELMARLCDNCGHREIAHKPHCTRRVRDGKTCKCTKYVNAASSSLSTADVCRSSYRSSRTYQALVFVEEYAKWAINASKEGREQLTCVLPDDHSELAEEIKATMESPKHGFKVNVSKDYLDKVSLTIRW